MAQETQLEKKSVDTITVLGNEAIAFGLRDGGIKFASAYPGTPSTEIMTTVLNRFPGKRQPRGHQSANRANSKRRA